MPVLRGTARSHRVHHAADLGHEGEVVYRKCPICTERMNRVNFGRQSGVILDSCGRHGVWLDGSKLRRLTEWWRAGGKLIYQENEARKTKSLYVPVRSEPRHPTGGIDSPVDSPEYGGMVNVIVSVISGLLALLLD